MERGGRGGMCERGGGRRVHVRVCDERMCACVCERVCGVREGVM